MNQDTPENAPVKESKSGLRRGRPQYSKNERFENKRMEVIELAAKGLTTDQIAGATGMSPGGVIGIIKRFSKVFPALERIDEYRQVKDKILSAGELAALESAFSGTKLAKAGFLSTLQGFDILNKANRLHTGQSTENIGHRLVGSVQVNHIIGDNDT